MPTALASRLVATQEKSLSYLPDPAKTEQRLHIQSAHNVSGLPKTRATNPPTSKVSFTADQHKYHPQTPTYHFPKHLSSVELLAKKYLPSSVLQNSTGLLWYNANEQTVRFLQYNGSGRA